MFTKSENIKLEYCAQVVKIGELLPIENSDFLVKTKIGGAYQVVVNKNDIQTGDIMIYCKLETAINKDFLSVNNQFELSERELNNNYEEVQKLIDEDKKDEARKMVGYFNKHGRVRIVKLRGCASEGCLFPISSLLKWKQNVAKFDFEKCFIPNEDGDIVPFEFDTIDGELFIETYIPPQKNKINSNSERRLNKKVMRFDRMVEGQFLFHYDTNKLEDNLWKFHPDTVVDITVKCHGTSFICGKLLTKKYLEENVFKKSFRKLKNFFINILNSIDHKDRKLILPDYLIEYGEVTSSRTVIKNRYINENVGDGYYEKDIWSEYGQLIYPYLDEGMTLYGEIVGYVSGTSSFIQKNYDYGCNVGENKLMPYRITKTDEDGNHKELNIEEVYKWTIDMIKKYPELEGRLKPITILYHGRLYDLYPELDIHNHWQENMFQKLSEEKIFLMEMNEPMCKNKVPREGLVIRIFDDEKEEAFKIKCKKYMFREAELIDEGEIDMEMEEGYSVEN